MNPLRSKSRILTGAAGLLAGASLSAIMLAQPSDAHRANDPAPVAMPALSVGPAAISNLPDLVERVSPSVVQILVRQPAETIRLQAPQQFDGLPPEFRRFFGPEFGGRVWPDRPVPDRRGSGSGFFVESGYIVTNQHVVDNASKLTVRLDDGTEVEATLVGADQKTDLAVIKVDPSHARRPLAWGDSGRARVGESVFTIGAPYSLGNTVTAGIISARGRDISSGPYDDYFQIDAPINPGNSGGPMFNSAGEVIGVNTAIYSPSGGNVGIGFSIPAEQAQSVVRQIIDRGHVERGWLGVNVQRMTPQIASSLRLGAAKGVLVADVTSGSPAERAGLKPLDVVLTFDGRQISTLHDLTRAVADTPPGSTRDIKIWRDGRERNLSVRIARLDEPAPAAKTSGGPAAGAGEQMSGLGLVLTTSGGRLVVADVDPDSPAAEAALRAGDIIVSIDTVAVRTVDDARKAVAHARGERRGAVLVQFERNGVKSYVGVNLRS